MRVANDGGQAQASHLTSRPGPEEELRTMTSFSEMVWAFNQI